MSVLSVAATSEWPAVSTSTSPFAVFAAAKLPQYASLPSAPDTYALTAVDVAFAFSTAAVTVSAASAGSSAEERRRLQVEDHRLRRRLSGHLTDMRRRLLFRWVDDFCHAALLFETPELSL